MSSGHNSPGSSSDDGSDWVMPIPGLLCSDGQYVTYSCPCYGIVYFPLSSAVSGGLDYQFNYQKHPRWLAEILAGSVTDFMQGWNEGNPKEAFKHFLSVFMATIAHYKHHLKTRDILLDFLEDYLQIEQNSASSAESEGRKRRRSVRQLWLWRKQFVYFTAGACAQV